MFAKVFAQILDSSLADDYQVRLVFEDLLKLADQNGVVDITKESIARRTNVPIDIVRRGIEELEKPDSTSRTPDFQGRRIIRLDEHRDWGWKIVNFLKYRESATKEMLRMGEAERKNAWRKRNGFSPTPPLPTQKKQSTEAEADKSRTVDGQVRDKSGTFTENAKEALIWLNQKSGRNFRETDTNLTIITARMKEPGVDLEGIKTMIDRQCARWKGTSQEEYLRPETLFGKTKFDGYYASKDSKIHQTSNGAPVSQGAELVGLKSIIDGLKRDLEASNNELQYDHDRTPDRLQRRKDIKARLAIAEGRQAELVGL